MEQVYDFHGFLLIIITAISLFVLALLLWVMVRYNKRSNPTPRKFSHNTFIEVVWTVIPALIVVAIVIPSFNLLYYGDKVPEADMTVKATGYQWFWAYAYPDHGEFEYFSNMLPREDLGEDAFGEPQPYLLAVDADLVVPAGKVIKLQVTAADVLHSFAVPAFGVKTDAVPGRLNETWFKVDKPGVYYGQCSEMCGQRHAFMPIAVRVVPQADFDAWVKARQEEFGIAAVQPAATASAATSGDTSGTAELAAAD